MTLDFGTQIVVRNRFERVIAPTDFMGPRHKRKEWTLVPLKKPLTVTIIGKRTLSNGNVDWDPDCGYSYDPREFLFAYLVATNMRTKPFLVPYFENT